MRSTRDVQLQLKSKGFNPGAIDGIQGRNTIAAIKAFQASVGILADGIVGPITAAKLFDNPVSSKSDLGAGLPPWFELAMTKKGFNEGIGHADLAKFLRSDGESVGDPAKVPWCGDFVETCIALTLPTAVLPSNPYLARNWMGFGVNSRPYIGAVAVFWRTSKEHSSDGHVGFCAGLDSDRVYVLGGNQSNQVKVAPVSIDRLLGFRWPKGYEEGRIAPPMTGGVLSYNEL